MKKIRNKVGSWVTGDDFFDREEEIKFLTNLLDNGENVLIVAPRRVGKTSLIRETFRRMEDRNSDYLLYVDVQDCSNPLEVIVAVSLAAQPHRKLHEIITDAVSAFFEQVRSNVESVGAADLFEIRLRASLKDDWKAKGRKIIHNLAKADRPIVVCLDELPIMLTRLLNPSPSKESARIKAEIFMSWLRNLMSDVQGRIRFVVCGSIGIEPILKRYGLSHTVNHLRPYHLRSWSRETARECLNELVQAYGLEIISEARETMLDYLPPYIPHHVQMFFGHQYEDCLRRKDHSPTREDVERVYETYMLSTRGHAELADYEERLLRVLDHAAKTLALDLITEAAVSDELTMDNARKLAASSGVTNGEEVLRQVLDVLQHDGYIEWSEKAGGWRFVSRLVKDWWKKRFGDSYVSPSERF